MAHEWGYEPTTFVLQGDIKVVENDDMWYNHYYAGSPAWLSCFANRSTISFATSTLRPGDKQIEKSGDHLQEGVGKSICEVFMQYPDGFKQSESFWLKHDQPISNIVRL